MGLELEKWPLNECRCLATGAVEMGAIPTFDEVEDDLDTGEVEIGATPKFEEEVPELATGATSIGATAPFSNTLLVETGLATGYADTGANDLVEVEVLGTGATETGSTETGLVLTGSRLRFDVGTVEMGSIEGRVVGTLELETVAGMGATTVGAKFSDLTTVLGATLVDGATEIGEIEGATGLTLGVVGSGLMVVVGCTEMGAMELEPVLLGPVGTITGVLGMLGLTVELGNWKDVLGILEPEPLEPLEPLLAPFVLEPELLPEPLVLEPEPLPVPLTVWFAPAVLLITVVYCTIELLKPLGPAAATPESPPLLPSTPVANKIPSTRAVRASRPSKAQQTGPQKPDFLALGAGAATTLLVR